MSENSGLKWYSATIRREEKGKGSWAYVEVKGNSEQDAMKQLKFLTSDEITITPMHLIG